MQTSDTLKITGQVNIKVFDADGKLTKEVDHHNLVVDAGKSFIASRIATNIETPMNHMALGQGSVSASAGDVSLLEEVANGRIAIASPIVTGNKIAFTGIFPPLVATGNAVCEAAIFNSLSGGTMLCRTVFPAIVKSETDTVAISWTITIS